MRRLLFLAFLGAAACGGDDGGSNTIDAPKAIDARPATVMEVNPCPGTVDGTVSTSEGTFSYSPATTMISQNGVVKFNTTLSHNVVSGIPAGVPGGGPGDPGLAVGFNQTKCFKFTQAGTFDFYCGPHQFRGKIVVQ